MRFILIGRSSCSSLTICAQVIPFSVVRDTLVTIVIKMAPKKELKVVATARNDVALKVVGRYPITKNKFVDKFKKSIADNTLQKDLGKAYAAAKAGVSLTASGKAVAQRSVADVKALATASNKDHSVLFSGTLSQLNLPEPSESTVDCGRICQLLDSPSISDLQSMIGPIIINLDQWSCDTAADLYRCNGDADVAALCLMRYWGFDDKVLVAELDEVATDLTFDCKSLGAGSKLQNNKFILNDREELKRQSAGMSGWRVCCKLYESSRIVELEKRHLEEKTPVERLIKAMEEDGVKMIGRNADTIKRYMAVGERLQPQSIQAKLMIWESYEKRGTLIDNVTTIRSIVAVCPTTEQLEFVLNVLFLEQRAQLRPDMITSRSHQDARTPTNRMKAIILRNCLLLHISETFPAFKDLVLSYQTEAYVKATYQIDKDGTRPDSFKELESEEEDVNVTDDKDADVGNNGVTSHTSRTPLEKICKELATNQLERTLCSMCKETSFQSLSVDLTVKAAAPIVQRLDGIAFASRFPP